MDSFLEEPRTIPQPAPIIQEIETPTVPEVSLMFQNTRKEKASPVQLGKTGSYNAWKLRKTNETPEMDSFLLTDKENTSDKSYLSKKQVRFESPVSHYALGKMKKVTSPLTESNTEQVYKPISTSPKFQTLRTPDPPKNLTKPFEKLYISNIPSRDKQLDLSFLEYQPRQCGTVNTHTYTNLNQTDPRKYSTLNETYKTHSPKLNRTAPDIRLKSPKNIYMPPVVSNTGLTDQEMSKKIQEIKEKNLLETTSQSETVINGNEIESNVYLDTNAIEIQKENTINCENQKEYKIHPDDPISVNELLAIIKLQNEQLQNLQKTVDKLVKMSEKQHMINKTSESVQKTIEKTTDLTQQTLNSSETSEPLKTVDHRKTIDTIQQINSSPKRHEHRALYRDQQVGTTFDDTQPQPSDGKNKISVGLMTSFEVRQVCVKPPAATRKKKKFLPPVDDETTSTSIYYHQKPTKKQYMQNKQQYVKNKKQHERFLQHQKCVQSEQYYKPQRKNFDRVENQNWVKETNETEYSLGSGEDLEVQEPPESPENSIHIDMQEYDTESEESDDECTTDEGWTFYKDILGQVNHLLENSPEPTPQSHKTNHYNDLNLEQIKHDTMKRLQSEGFLRNGNVNPTEVSFAVKQILMKYMPDEGLANVHNNYEDKNPKDMSIAAFKYTQQYNLRAPNRKAKKLRNKDPKILDITTLKQQPKYL